MTQGVSGYFDLPGTAGYGFTGRFFYSEEYDKLSGKRKVSNTGISIQSTVYGGTWYPGGTVAVEGETLGTMTYEGVTTHMVTVNAGEVWYSVDAIADQGGEFPWVSGEIESNPDGSKSVTFDVDLTLYRNSSSPKVSIRGSVTIDLTKLNFGPRAFVRRGGAFVEVYPRVKRGGAWIEPRGKVGGRQ